MYSAAISNILINAPFGLLLCLITGAVGGIALYIYFKQAKDQRTLAAQTIFSEIITAENRLKGIRARFFATETATLESDVIMKYESWSKFKYFFLNDLTADEWNLVDSFFNNCSEYDSAILSNKNSLTQIIGENYKYQYAYYAKIVAKFHKQNPQDTELSEEVMNDALKFQSLYLNKVGFDYFPRLAVTGARTALVAVDTSVSASSAGQKLRKLSGLKLHLLAQNSSKQT